MRIPDKAEAYRLFGMEAKKVSLHLKLRYILEEDQAWHLHIVVDDMTTAAELREVWKDVDQAREVLKLWQGTNPNWFSISFLLDLAERKKKASYKNLAMDLNFEAMVYLLWATDIAKGENNATGGYITFVNILNAIGVKDLDIRHWESDGRENITNNNPPWGLRNGPIKERRVIDSLRQFELEKKSRKIVITPLQSTDHLDKIRNHTFTGGYWLKARKLLERYNSDEYRRYEKRLSQRFIELFEKSIEFSGLNSQ